MQANRRQVFAALLAAAAARQVKAADGIAIPGKRPMILHNDRPEDLETPVKYFDNWVTPIDAFFVRQHLPRPAAVDPAAYRLNLTGLVSRHRQLTLAHLEKLPQHTLPAPPPPPHRPPPALPPPTAPRPPPPPKTPPPPPPPGGGGAPRRAPLFL